jgi:hypothetical protein
MSELVYPDLLRQRLLLPFLRCRRCQSAHTTLHPRTSRGRSGRAVGARSTGLPNECPTQVVDRSAGHRAPEGPFVGPTLPGRVHTAHGTPAQPCATPRERAPENE